MKKCKTSLIGIFFAVSVVAALGCLDGKHERSEDELDDRELALAITTSVPETFLVELKSAGRNLRQLEGVDDDGNPTKLMGVTIDVPDEEREETLRELRKKAPAGCFVFVSERNFGLSGAPDHLSVVKADSPYQVIKQMGTNGLKNYDVTNEIVVNQLKEWDKRFGLVFHGIGIDWIEAEFKKQPSNMLEFAKELYDFNPASDPVEATAEGMKRNNTVFLYWRRW